MLPPAAARNSGRAGNHCVLLSHIHGASTEISGPQRQRLRPEGPAHMVLSEHLSHTAQCPNPHFNFQRNFSNFMPADINEVCQGLELINNITD